MSQAASGRQVARTASLLAALSLLSKPVNFLKDIVVAALFGTTAAKDAFLVAWVLPDLISSLVTEGLSGVLVPIFSEFLGKGDEKQAWRVASSIANAILLLLSLAALIVAVGAPWIVPLLAPAFPAETRTLAIRLTRLMAIGMVFMGIQGLLSSVLNSYQRFVAPALVPLAFNSGTIIILLLTAHTMGIDSLALATVAGTLCMLLIQLPRLPRGHIQYHLGIDTRLEGTQRFGRLMGPLMLGTLILSATSIANRIFGSFLPEGSLSALDFALRTTGPAYIIAPALATVLLPTLSRQAILGQWQDFRDRLLVAVKMHILVSLPASVILILLSEPVVRLLFQRGAFDARSTSLTAGALAWYSLGLVACGLYVLLINAFYALQNTIIRVQAGSLVVAAYIAANLVLIPFMGINGIALAYSLAFAAACVFLLARLGRRLQWHVEREAAGFCGRIALATMIMGLVVVVLRHSLGPDVWQGRLIVVLGGLLAAGTAGALTYGAALWLLGVTEIRRLPDLFRRG